MKTGRIAALGAISCALIVLVSSCSDQSSANGIRTIRADAAKVNFDLKYGIVSRMYDDGAQLETDAESALYGQTPQGAQGTQYLVMMSDYQQAGNLLSPGGTANPDYPDAIRLMRAGNLILARMP